MDLFYFPAIEGKQFTLDEEESNHMIRVHRLKTNDEAHFTDGKGFFYQCRIVEANPKRCLVAVEQQYEGTDRRNFSLHIAIAPTKNINRFEWFLEKSTEIGIDWITPIICDHSERKQLKTDRLNRVITAAMKQSVKSIHPQLNETMEFNDFVKKTYDGQKFIAHVDKDINLALAKAYKVQNNVVILIGPEGDFSPKEIKLALENGYVPIHLGPSRLRTETAGIVACYTINLLNI